MGPGVGGAEADAFAEGAWPCLTLSMWHLPLPIVQPAASCPRLLPGGGRGLPLLHHAGLSPPHQASGSREARHSKGSL